MSDKTVALTADELAAVVMHLEERGHGKNGGDYEPECPTCTAVEKMKAATAGVGIPETDQSKEN